VAGSCECGNELPGSIKCGEFHHGLCGFSNQIMVVIIVITDILNGIVG
jgi:hypothetical protein